MAERSTPRSLLTSARDAMRPTYDLLIGDPMREGRIRLDGVPGWIRQAGIVGIVALVGLLFSLLAIDVWRRGSLIHLASDGGRLTYVPTSLFPVTMVALLVGWLLLVLGALQASVFAKLGLALAFLLIHAPIGGEPIVRFAVSGFVLAPILVPIGYAGVPAVLALHSATSLRKGWAERLRIPASILAALLLAGFFGGLLWSHRLQVENGVPPNVPFLLASTLRKVQLLLAPLVVIGGLAIVDFSRNVSAALVAPAWRRKAIAARWLLVGLVAAKLWIQVGRHRDEWLAKLTDRPRVFFTGLFVLAILGVMAWLAGRPRRSEGTQTAKERVTRRAALALSAPTLLVLLISSLSAFFIRLGMLGPARVFAQMPLLGFVAVFDLVVWLGVATIGFVLLRRGEEASRELAVGLALVGSWAAAFFALRLVELEPAVDLAVIDVLLTVAVGVYAVAAWRRLSATKAVGLAAVVLFGWLVLSEGDLFGIIGSLFGLPGTFLVVIGTVFALIAGSGFTAEDTPRFPRPSRAMLWIGYVIVSLAIGNWVTATHSNDVTGEAGARAFFYVGIPVAVWLLTRTPFAPPQGDNPPT